MSSDLFFRHPALPFAECRYSKESHRHYKPHMHKAFCIAAIEKGEVDYLVAGELARLRPGGIGLINPQTLHACNPDTACQRTYFMLFLDENWCLKLQQAMWGVKTFSPAVTHLLADEPLFDRCLGAMKALVAEGDLLEKEQLLVETAEAVFQKACRPGETQTAQPLMIDQARQLLESDLDQDLTLGQAASELGANPYTLLRQFKAATGLTPHAFRLNCRIERAKKLLQQGMEISQVALESGFFDQSHFHRHFKAMTTLTPKAYQVNFIQ